MSTATTSSAPSAPTAPVRERRQVEVRPVTPGRVLASEWVKLRSLRSTWYTLAAAVAAMVVVGSLICWAINNRWDRMPKARLADFEPIGRSLGGVDLAQLAVGVLGVLIISGEYSTGMIRSTLAAAPRRWPVLVAKTVLFAAVTFVTMLVASFLAFLCGQHFLGTHGTTLSADGAVRAVVAVAGYLTLVGMLAVGIGFVVRSTAGGIATFVGLMLVLPGIGELLPDDWQPHVLPYLPSNAGSAMYAVHAAPSDLSPGAGLLTLVAWVVVALVAAAALLLRRDA